MSIINTQAVVNAALQAAEAEANKVFPELVEGSEPTVVATVSAVFDVIDAGLTAGFAKIPFVGGWLGKSVSSMLLTVQNTVDEYIQTQADKLQAVQVPLTPPVTKA